MEPNGRLPRGRVAEPMIFRLARENADAVRAMGRDAIRELHAAGVDAHYRDASLGEGMVRESPDGVRHLERKFDGVWVEVAAFPPSPDWRQP